MLGVCSDDCLSSVNDQWIHPIHPTHPLSLAAATDGHLFRLSDRGTPTRVSTRAGTFWRLLMPRRATASPAQYVLQFCPLFRKQGHSSGPMEQPCKNSCGAPRRRTIWRSQPSSKPPDWPSEAEPRSNAEEEEWMEMYIWRIEEEEAGAGEGRRSKKTKEEGEAGAGEGRRRSKKTKKEEEGEAGAGKRRRRRRKSTQMQADDHAMKVAASTAMSVVGLGLGEKDFLAVQHAADADGGVVVAGGFELLGVPPLLLRPLPPHGAVLLVPPPAAHCGNKGVGGGGGGGG